MSALKMIANRCVLEIEAAGLKGKKRDDFAFAFMAGAMIGHMVGDDGQRRRDVDVNPEGVMLLVGSRGFSAVVDMAERK